jgi:hypothetical protein
MMRKRVLAWRKYDLSFEERGLAEFDKLGKYERSCVGETNLGIEANWRGSTGNPQKHEVFLLIAQEMKLMFEEVDASSVQGLCLVKGIVGLIRQDEGPRGKRTINLAGSETNLTTATVYHYQVLPLLRKSQGPVLICELRLKG